MNRALLPGASSRISTPQRPLAAQQINSATPATNAVLPAESHPLYPILKAIKEEAIAHKEEMKVMKAQLHQFNGLLCGLQDEVKKLTSTVKTANEKGFTIEDSGYKVM